MFGHHSARVNIFDRLSSSAYPRCVVNEDRLEPIYIELYTAMVVHMLHDRVNLYLPGIDFGPDFVGVSWTPTLEKLGLEFAIFLNTGFINLVILFFYSSR